MPAEVRLAHTAWLNAGDLRAIRALLDDAFAGDFAEEDFEHGLGGMHALVWDGATLVGHGAVVMRRLLHDGATIRTGYVEGVGVHPEHRRRGHASAVMSALEAIIDGGYELGALGSSDMAVNFYRARGWQLWTGTASVIAPSGLQRTPEDEGAIYLRLGRTELRRNGDLACDWRPGDVW